MGGEPAGQGLGVHLPVSGVRAFPSRAWRPKGRGHARAETPIYSSIGSGPPKPYGPMLEFLDAAASLSSHPDFARLDGIAQVRMLMDLLKENLVTSDSALAKAVEAAGPRGFNEVMCSGTGVCRHLAPALGMALSEAGFKVRLLRYTGTEKVGHAWLEVDLPGADGKLVTHVIEPTVRGKGKILTLEQARANAQADPTSLDARFYVQKGRMDGVTLLPIGD